MDDRTIDLIFAGSMKSLPPVSSKIVRIFTSSTFTDTTMERNTLMAKCYPRIKDYCREKHGLEFQVVDMRWGVRDEATDDHMTTELCMREIQNCQRLSMGPNFVVFLGQKYGYRPIPTYILSSELLMLRDDLAAGGTDVILLDTWYRKDSNAVPPISVLQPISSILVNFNNKRVPKLQAEDQAIWWDTLNKMQKLFRKASLSLFTAGKIDKDTMHNYYMSVTEREVINGVLNVKNTKNHCLAYVRYINNINLQNLKKASLFVDILNRSLDTESSKLLADLRDERLPNKIETTNMQKYTVEWIGREGLDTDTHGEYLNHFVSHFYRNIIKLVDRAMRREDGSAQGQIVTELLQHLHACNNSVKVFYGRKETLERIESYMLGPSTQPIVLYGEGGCGKTSLLSKSAALSATEWFANRRPISIIRFLGTTPDSSALTPTLISICQQISYNFSLPFETIPDDLVPLTAHFKQLLTCANYEQPLLLFLDSVDQLTGAQDVSKVSWLPTKLPPFCKVIVTCACEESNPVVSREYNMLRRMIDNDENFVEVTALGEDLAMQVIKMWMKTACRDLNNYQWRLVANAISACSLPIFVKLVFAEVCRWRSYTRPQDTKLAATVMDSIMMLFERIEKQHGRILVFHALAYITAARSGLSESELEDLISLDDKVLDDVYQYHMPPVRRIPPLLWTRIRNDLPNYLSEREADGVSVMSWYHRQFRDAAKERYFKNMNMALYFHSSIADYYLGIWGGGVPKPFKYTEIQRHRFNLTDKEGVADRKVPIQPLVFVSAEGAAQRYNLRKFGELPFHLVRSRRFKDLYENVLFNYAWLHAKLRSCPLQAVLADFEDACQHIENKEATRELALVADALRLGGAVLGIHPDMLAPQLLGRLLPEVKSHAGLRSLLKQCDEEGRNHCALLPLHHCLHTPGGPLKYSLEGHQFAVFSFKLTSDFRYIVSISNKFITWDLATSDMARDVCPQLEGIMQQLAISPDNKWAAAYTNNDHVVVLNMLSSELVTMAAPFGESGNGETVCGVFLLDNKLMLHSASYWGRFSLGGEVQEIIKAPDVDNEDENEKHWEILSMEFTDADNYHMILWSGVLDDSRLRVYAYRDSSPIKAVDLESAFVMSLGREIMYCCNGKGVTRYRLNKDKLEWEVELELEYEANEEADLILQLKTAKSEQMLIATTTYTFSVWDFNGLVAKSQGPSDPDDPPPEPDICADNETKAIVLHLPHTIRNISTKLMQSNSAMISSNNKYAVAGVRKNLYIWSLVTAELVKVLDAHFGRIVQLESLTVGRWNSVITSSIDRSVKVWNIDNIFEQVHVIDRHELPIDSISLCKDLPLAVTVTRGCFGIWDLKTGKLKAQLSDSPLGAIITHVEITPDGTYIIAAESGNVVIWDRAEQKVLFREEQQGIKQLILMEDGAKCLTVSKPKNSTDDSENVKLTAVAILRTIPEGEVIYTFEYPIKCSPGIAFRNVVISSDEQNVIAPSLDKNGKECLSVYNAKTGAFIHRIPMKMSGIKDMVSLVAMPHKPNWIAVIGVDRGSIIDIKGKRHVRIIPRWGGQVTKDGKFGLFAPTRGGLELLELKKGQTVKTFIPKVAEGVFTVMSSFSTNDEYVLYYHAGKKTLRVFRMEDATKIAEYRVPAELTAMGSTSDRNVVLGTLDGALAILALADPALPTPVDLLNRHGDE